jgi:pre-mRNA-processing factor 17
MHFLSQYESDNEPEQISNIKNINEIPTDYNQEKINDKFLLDLKNIEAAPDVDVSHLVHQKNYEIIQKFESGYNIPEKQNHVTGFINNHTINDFNFNEQYYTYKAYGFAQDPTDFSNNKIIGDVEKYNNNDSTKSVFMNTGASQKDYKKKLKMKRMKYGDPASGDFMGPWAIYEGEEVFKNLSGELTEEQKEIMKQNEEKRQKKMEEEKENENKVLNFTASSIFHLQEESDYQGRSYLDPPPHLKNVDHTCFIPKKLIHTYSGHTKAVQAIEFFPKIGHFVLSCSLDCKVKLWDVLSHRKCVRTYIGHSEGVRDISFSNDGRRFLSAGFDKNVQLWDTETGKVLSSFPNKKIPFCVVFNPDDDKQNQFLVGTSAKKICQYDINTGKLIQSYDEHIGAINSITFLDNNRKFVSTSDDKKIFIWEYGLPVVVKHISEPSMHSIPAVAMHPNGKYFVGQSLDNKVNKIIFLHIYTFVLLIFLF